MNLNRRNFLKTSGTAVAGTIFLPPFIKSCSELQISTNVKNYLDHFEISTAVLVKVISEAMSKGGDYADLFFEHRITNNIGLQDGKVNSASSNIDYGVGIRVLKGDQTGFAYSESLELQSMLDAAKLAASIANSPGTFDSKIFNEKVPANYYSIKTGWEDVSVKDKVPFVQKLNDRIFSLDDKVLKVNAMLNDETSYVLFYNSEGRLTWDYRTMTSFVAVCIMQKGKQIENSLCSRSYRKGFE